MISQFGVAALTLIYLSILFAVAYWGDRYGVMRLSSYFKNTAYALTLSIYFTAWTFYGTIGFILSSGLDYLAISIAPFLLMIFGAPLIKKLAHIAREQRATSTADFIATRYGKSANVAAAVAIVCIIAAFPYNALQLKAISLSMEFILNNTKPLNFQESFFSNYTLIVTVVLALLTAIFGTRYIDAKEPQTGISLAVALAATIKILCFIAVSLFALILLYNSSDISLYNAFKGNFNTGWLHQTSRPVSYLTLVSLGALGFLLMPRQFYVLFVENNGPKGIERASFIFPFYLLLINIFMLPLALAGKIFLDPAALNSDFIILAIPAQAGSKFFTVLTYLGGLSGAIAMIVIEAIAISIMVSNHLVMPSILRRSQEVRFEDKKLGSWLIHIRRLSIIAVILAGYIYYRLLPQQSFASMGWLSVAFISQLGPTFIGSFLWKRGTAFGAIAGMASGILIWLIAPFLGIFFDHIKYFNPFSLEHIETGKPFFIIGVLLSWLMNGIFYILFSLITPREIEPDIDGPSVLRKRNAARFGLTVNDLRMAVARYYGEEQAQESFTRYFQSKNQTYDGSLQADEQFFIFVERLLTSFIGGSSARLALTLLVRKGPVSTQAAQQLLDDASAAIQHSRNVFQSALDNARQGVVVLDNEMKLTAWNKAFKEIYSLPKELVVPGTPLETICRSNAERGIYGTGDIETQVNERLLGYSAQYRFVRQKVEPGSRTIEIRSSRLPDGGVVATHTDVTDLAAAEDEQIKAQELLEKRVQERTEELTRLNEELRTAKAEADAANQSKTRFLAAASHDILQPLNAARLYSASMLERDRRLGDATLADNISISLDAVEEILMTLLDMSRLDSGASKPEFFSCLLGNLTQLLQKEFEPLARQKGLELRFVHSSVCVRSDRRLLRRLVQNLISNAIKYTQSGRILIGVRKQGENVRLEVWDTGMGIPEAKKSIIFEEFKRLDEGARVAKGLGLGLSIVERVARLLKHPLTLDSEVGKGSVFKLTLTQMHEPPHNPNKPNEPVPQLGALSGLDVFVIDNEPSILQGMRVLLEGWGCSVTVASSLQEALSVFDPEKLPDIIIADYHLDNGENGIQVIAALHEEAGLGIPAALLTADRSPEMHAEAAEIGALVLNKPLKPAALRALLARIRSGKMDIP